jgi:OHCU decarboxylase
LGAEIYKRLAWLNELSAEAAEAAFFDCCGSTEWARRMAAARPFRLLNYLFEGGEEAWFALSTVDQLEAFAASQTSAEQLGQRIAAGDIRRQLADITHLYEEKFGFIFIVSATERSAEEVLAICKARLGNSPETELKLAAIEQWKITEARLKELLES